MTIYPQELTCLICDRELDNIMEPSHNGDSYTVEWIDDKKDIDSSKNAVSLKKEVKKL